MIEVHQKVSQTSIVSTERKLGREQALGKQRATTTDIMSESSQTVKEPPAVEQIAPLHLLKTVEAGRSDNHGASDLRQDLGPSRSATKSRQTKESPHASGSYPITSKPVAKTLI